MFNMEFDDTDALELETDSLFNQFVDIDDPDKLFDMQSINIIDITDVPSSIGIETSSSSVSSTCDLPKFSKDSKRTQGVSVRSSGKPKSTLRNAARERSRVKSLRSAFLELQNSLPSVPPNTKLSKLDILVLATTYIAHLMKVLDDAKDDSNIVSSSINTISRVPLPPSGGESTDGGGNGSAHSEGRHHRLHEKGYLHPVRKWPMRSRLYAGVFDDKRYSSSTMMSQMAVLHDGDFTLPGLDSLNLSLQHQQI